MTADKVGTPLTTVLAGDTSSIQMKKNRPEPKAGIVKVDLSTGKSVGELALDDDQPIYYVDAENGKLFYVVRDRRDRARNHRSVAAYAF